MRVLNLVYFVKKIPSVFEGNSVTKRKAEYDNHMKTMRNNTIMADDFGYPSDDKIIEMWKNAQPKVENLTETICIMLVLPNLAIISVSPISKNEIEVVLTGRIKKDNKILKYYQKFTFMGNGVHIKEDDLLFNYDNSYGGLFIYIKNIQLTKRPLNPLSHTRKYTSSRPINPRNPLLYETPRKPSSSKPNNYFNRRSLYGGRRTRKRKTGRRHKKKT